MQVRHAQELEAEIRAKERLSEKLDRYLDVVKVAEMERDDLREAVIALVKKGGFTFILVMCEGGKRRMLI